MLPRSIFSIRIITTILAISIIINNLNIIINIRCSSQPFGVMFCCRRRSRSPRPAAGAARVRAWRLEVEVCQSLIDGVGPLYVVEVLPWVYGPSEESLFDWLLWLHADTTDKDYGLTIGFEEASEFFFDYKTVPIYY